MRHDSPDPSSTHRIGAPSSASVDTWRAHMRSLVLEGLADGMHGLSWTHELLSALLEELHITEEFEQLAGSTPTNPKRDAARLLALALFLRHSWDPADLDVMVDRVLFRACDLEVADASTPGDRGPRHRRSDRTSLAPLPGPRARKEQP